MSNSDYLRRKVTDKYHMALVKADVKRDEALEDAEDSGADTDYLKDRAYAGAAIAKERAWKKYKSDQALVHEHGNRAAKARGFGTNYNAKPYANKPRKPKANLK